MAKKLYDLAVKTGEYNDSNGNKKGRYANIGCVMQSDDGNKFLMIDRWFNPAGVPDLSGKGSGSILVSMFEPKDRNSNNSGEQQQQRQQPAQQQQQQQKNNGFEDDIPF